MLDNIFVCHASVFGAQALVESDCGISKCYAVAGRFGFGVYSSCGFGRQRVSGSDLCISKKCVSSMSNDI